VLRLTDGDFVLVDGAGAPAALEGALNVDAGGEAGRGGSREGCGEAADDGEVGGAAGVGCCEPDQDGRCAGLGCP